MDRLNRLRLQLEKYELDCMLVLQPENRRYISGFSGSSGALLVTGQQAFLFTDFRYLQQAAAQAPGFQVIEHGPVLWETIAKHAAGKMGFEQNFITYEQFLSWQDLFTNCILTALPGVVEGLRCIKEEKELQAMQAAADLADQAFTQILPQIKPGVSEKDIALELEFFMRRAGASAAAFDFIVASGPRSSLPHGVATERTINRGDFVKLDFGPVVNGYCSDITRTVIVGEASEKQREIYSIVHQAQEAALQAIKPGMTGKEADTVAREIIKQRGYGDNFGHGLGHGVGMVVHEEPRLSPSGDRILEPGMVVTVEPGIYLPGFGGVRIEDTIVITADGNRPLTKSPKQLIVL